MDLEINHDAIEHLCSMMTTMTTPLSMKTRQGESTTEPSSFCKKNLQSTNKKATKLIASLPFLYFFSIDCSRIIINIIVSSIGLFLVWRSKGVEALDVGGGRTQGRLKAKRTLDESTHHKQHTVQHQRTRFDNQPRAYSTKLYQRNYKVLLC
jgi:hypothetical protein